jgi:hypothetical protein
MTLRQPAWFPAVGSSADARSSAVRAVPRSIRRRLIVQQSAGARPDVPRTRVAARGTFRSRNSERFCWRAVRSLVRTRRWIRPCGCRLRGTGQRGSAAAPLPHTGEMMRAALIVSTTIACCWFDLGVAATPDLSARRNRRFAGRRRAQDPTFAANEAAHMDLIARRPFARSSRIECVLDASRTPTPPTRAG